MLTWAVLAASIPFAALAVVTTLPVGLALAFVAGAGALLTEVVGVTILQPVLDERVLARVFGILDTTVIGCHPRRVGRRASPCQSGRSALDPRERRRVRAGRVARRSATPTLAVGSARARRRELAAPVRLLARQPVFHHAPRPVIERVAADMDVEAYGTGATIITHGDVPDDFYGSSRVRVGVYSVDDMGCDLVNELGPATGSARSAYSRACPEPRPRGRSSRCCSTGSPGISS